MIRVENGGRSGILTMHEPTHFKPKFRRARFSGYRASDVEMALAQLNLRISQLAADLQRAETRVAEVEAERGELAEQLADVHRRDSELAAASAAAAEIVTQAEEDARDAARAVVEAAHLDAARIRTEAAQELDAVRGQLDELLRLRATASKTMRGVVEEFERIAGRLDAPEDDEPAEANEPDDRSVEIEAGPFPDVVSLSAFERALEQLPEVTGIQIRRFEDSRATIDLTLELPPG